jgi:DUF4097 and DUF4098 domain-containing protein YvlB
MIRSLAVLSILVCANAQAWECKFERELDETLQVEGSHSLAIAAAAGDLEINGVSGTSEVRIKGKICASREEWLEESDLDMKSGERAELSVVLPSTDGSWSLWGSNYAYMDLEIEVPNDLDLKVRDSSGDIEIENVAAVKVKDSSGDITINHASGKIEVEDSSGDIRLDAISNDVTIISDSSGDIRGKHIEGSVLVESDSSGDIRFSDVEKDVVVDRDSSGDISAKTVGGDFRVLRDGSGDIHYTDVEGDIEIPEHKG